MCLSLLIIPTALKILFSIDNARENQVWNLELLRDI